MPRNITLDGIRVDEIRLYWREPQEPALELSFWLTSGGQPVLQRRTETTALLQGADRVALIGIINRLLAALRAQEQVES